MANKSRYFAKKMRIDQISAIWIIPIVTLIIALWMIFTHITDQGKSITLIADDASGIVAGKTVIKSRSVNVGVVEDVTLSKDFKKVVIKSRIDKDMEPLIKNDSVFWIVKPQIDRDGITGLNTLLSGVYIELISGSDSATFNDKSFELSSTPPITAPSDAGIRINLDSDQNGVIPRGAAVMFRGFRVGNVEKSDFDIQSRKMKYQLFITKPYDNLVTKNVRFWKEGGVNFTLSSQGANLEVPSLDVLLSGGVSFDVPEGADFGEKANEHDTYQLFADKTAIKDSQFTQYKEFLLLFDDSISGLKAGAPVSYRGIRIGSVSKVPFFTKEMKSSAAVLSYNIPVLIRIEPERLNNFITESFDLYGLLKQEQKHGLRAALKSDNLFTGSLYVSLDYYERNEATQDDELYSQKYGYDTILTVSAGLSHLQTKITELIDNLNKLPLDKTINEFNKSLVESQKMLESITKITSSNEMQNLPKDLRDAIESLNNTLQGLQPGSKLHNQLQTDLNKFEKMLDELTPVLNTLNDKSNALIFAAPKKDDPTPKAKGN
ncbi:intermembrane transport protein PqiB [Orbaceae bacterium ac157xtp]